MKMPLKNKLVIYVIFAIIIVLLPRAFTKTSETRSVSIVTAMGIDKVDEDIEISVQIIVPKPQSGTTKNLMTVSAKNKDVSLALEDISIYLGKTIGIEHCDALVIGKEISKNGIQDIFDYFFRGKKIEHNMLLIYYDGNAKELIASTTNIDKNFSLSLDEITKTSSQYFSTFETTIEKFYSEHYSNNKTSVVGVLKIKEGDYGLTLGDSNGGGESSSSSSQSGSQSNSSGSSGSQGESSKSSSSDGNSSGENKSNSKSKFLINSGESVVFKDWKAIKTLDHNQTISMNWFYPDAKKYSLRIDDVNDSLFNGASVVFSIFNKRVGYKANFVGNVPVLEVNLNIDLKVENIIGGDKKDFENINKNLFTPMLKSRVIGKILNDAYDIMDLLKQEKLDLIKIYDKFEKTNYAQLTEYINKNGIDAFYNALIPCVKVNITEKI